MRNIFHISEIDFRITFKFKINIIEIAFTDMISNPKTCTQI